MREVLEFSYLCVLEDCAQDLIGGHESAINGFASNWAPQSIGAQHEKIRIISNMVATRNAQTSPRNNAKQQPIELQFAVSVSRYMMIYSF